MPLPTEGSVAPPSAPAVSTVAAPGPSRRSRPPSGPRLSAADRARVGEVLRDARRLTREGEHAEALTRFEEALAIDRGAWRVECEAAFVAWRAENLDSADTHLRSAMNGIPPGFVPEALRVPTAMCLYNAGLIADARGNAEAARDMWEESLRLRPNDTVRGRLLALPADTEGLRPWQTLPFATPIEEIVAAMRSDFAAEGLAGFEAGTRSASEIPLEVQTLGSAAGIEVHRIHADFPVDGLGDQIIEALVVRGAGSLRAALLGQSYNAGRAISTTTVRIEPRFEDVLPGGQPEFVAQVNDMGGSVADGAECWGETHHLIVCSVDSAELRCFSVPYEETSIYSDESDEEPEVEGFCWTPLFQSGQVNFERCEDFAGTAPPFIQGTHDLSMLLDRGDIRWPDTWSPLEPVGS